MERWSEIVGGDQTSEIERSGMREQGVELGVETPEPPAAGQSSAIEEPPRSRVSTSSSLLHSLASSREDLFHTDHLHDDLKGRSVRGGAATLAGQAANFVLKLGSTAVLARLLTPADFGLIAMVTAVTGFVEMFKDAGLSMATVQRAEINHRQISTLFWLNVALSILLMLVVMTLAPVVAWFYGEPQLLWITIALGAMFPLGGLTIQHSALLRRQMRFGTIVSIDVLSNAIGIAAGIASAALGASYWALVSITCATGVAGAILVWICCPWVPSLPRRGAGVRSMLAFGSNLTGFNFVNFFARNADNLLIGWYWGAAALGLYSRAYQMLTFPLQQINAPVGAVAIPAMSRLQHQPEQWVRFYLRAVSAITLFTAPLSVFLLVYADDAVEFVLGPQWGRAAVIFRLLGISALLQPVGNSVGWVYTSLGQTDRMFRWGLFASTWLVGSFVVGLAFGPEGIALSYGVAVVLITWPGLAYAYRATPLSPKRVLRPVLARTAVAALAAAPTLLLHSAVLSRCSLSLPISLLASATLYSGFYLVAVLAVPSFRTDFSALIVPIGRFAVSGKRT